MDRKARSDGGGNRIGRDPIEEAMQRKSDVMISKMTSISEGTINKSENIPGPDHSYNSSKFSKVHLETRPPCSHFHP